MNIGNEPPWNVICGHSKRLSSAASFAEFLPGSSFDHIHGKALFGRAADFLLRGNWKNFGFLMMGFTLGVIPVLFFFEEPLGVQRGHAARAGGRDGLAVFE